MVLNKNEDNKMNNAPLQARKIKTMVCGQGNVYPIYVKKERMIKFGIWKANARLILVRDLYI